MPHEQPLTTPETSWTAIRPTGTADRFFEWLRTASRDALRPLPALHPIAQSPAVEPWGQQPQESPGSPPSALLHLGQRPDPSEAPQ